MVVKKTEYQLYVINILKDIRISQKASQEYISDILGLNSNGQIGNIESPRYSHKYTIKQIYMLCKEFNFPIEAVFLSEQELKLEKADIIECLIKKIIEYDG